jgi:lysophospholipase L1-like esterase
MIVIICASVFAIPVQAATEQLTWLDKIQSPALRTENTITGAEYNTSLTQRKGFVHQECIRKKVTTQTAPRAYYDGCWYTTSIGMLEQNGKYLLEPGAKIAGYIKGSVSDTSKLLPTLNPNAFVELITDYGTGYGYFMNFRDASTLKFNRDDSSSNGSITFTYQTNGIRLKTPSSSIHIEYSYIWYSSNAKWMIIFTEGGSFIRVNLETLTFTSVKLRDKPSNRWIPGMADITNDGRYVAATINGSVESELYLVDMQTCDAQDSATITGTFAKCQQRALKSNLQTSITPYRSISLPRFYSNHTLGLYHENTDHSYTQYVLQAPHTTEVTNNYLALGDSFASGEGAFEYETGTDIADQNMCHLSKRSYPYLINKQVALHDFHSAACSGAKIEHITSKSQAKKPDINPMGDLVPGYKNQLQYIQDAQQKPNILTISMAGNNIGFADKIKYCVTSIDSCFSSREDRQEIMNEIDDQFDKLTKMYGELKNSAAPNAKIYVIGYPQIITDSTDGNCGINVHLTTQERQLASTVVKYLNGTIMRAAQQAGLHYIDVEDAFDGSRLCETSSAATAVHGITAGKDGGLGSFKFIGKESFHPNEKGHQLLKDAILGKTGSFTHESLVVADGSNQEHKDELLQAPETHRTIRKTINSDTLTHESLLPGSEVTISANAFQYNLPANIPFEITLGSQDTKLGSVTANNNGDIQTTIRLPQDIEPGIHILHLYGKDEVGKDIDIYQYIQIIDENEEFTIDIPLDTVEPESGSSAENNIPQTNPQHSALLNFTLTPILPHSDSVTARLGEQPYVQNLASTPRGRTLGVDTLEPSKHGFSSPERKDSENPAPAQHTLIVATFIAISLATTLAIYKLSTAFYVKFK